MTNSWNIPDWLGKKVKIRDKFCVYCHVKLKGYHRTKGTLGDKATFEHIDNDGPPSEENIVMCCASCNASKGTKKILDWLESPYCKKKNITKETIAGIIKKFVEINE